MTRFFGLVWNAKNSKLLFFFFRVANQFDFFFFFFVDVTVTLRNLADCYAQVEEYNLAKYYFEQAIESDPNNTNA